VAALPADETGERLFGGRSITVRVEGCEYEFDPEDLVIEAHEREGFQVEREGAVAVAISTRLSTELLREGLARELVHHIQNTRKAAGYQIDDRIYLRVSGSPEVADMLAVHGDWVKKETLALGLDTGLARETTERAGGAVVPMGVEGWFRDALKVNGLPVTVEVRRA